VVYVHYYPPQDAVLFLRVEQRRQPHAAPEPLDTALHRALWPEEYDVEEPA
jgi:hypothetical protein